MTPGTVNQSQSPDTSPPVLQVHHDAEVVKGVQRTVVDPKRVHMSEHTDPQGVKQVVEEVPDQNEEPSRKRKLPPSLVSTSVAPSTLTIRSLAAPRKPPVAISKGGIAATVQHLSRVSGDMAQTATVAWQPLASGQPSPSTEGNPSAQATQAATATAIKPSTPRRLPGSLAQPPAAGATTANPHVSTLK